MIEHNSVAPMKTIGAYDIVYLLHQFEVAHGTLAVVCLIEDHRNEQVDGKAMRTQPVTRLKLFMMRAVNQC